MNENKMGTVPVNKLLVSMVTPMVLSMLVGALYNVVDSLFVSHYGENALSAVSLAFPIQNIIIATGTGVGVGINALLSRYLGQKEQKAVNQTALHTLIANTKGEGEKSAEDFWVKSERLFYTALIGYIWYEAPAEEMNFTTLLEMINASEAREDDPDFQSPVDLMFERLEQKDPDHFAVRQYKKFLLSAGKTRSSILISCGARLAPFDIREVRELMENDEMELDTIGDEKTVLFLIMSDTDTTFNFILAMLQSQLINLLCDRADDKYGGRLPVHVRLILDEFANIGQIPNFDKLIATIRSREISA